VVCAIERSPDDPDTFTVASPDSSTLRPLIPHPVAARRGSLIFNSDKPEGVLQIALIEHRRHLADL